MFKDIRLNKPIYSSFLSIDKDIEEILRTLFVSNRPHSDILKRLLIINNPDCLDMENQDYKKVIDQYSVQKMLDKGYIRLNPKISRGTHEEIKSYIIISVDNFSSNRGNPQYRDYNVFFDIVCYNDAWVLNDYKIRPLSICGYIDGILNSVQSEKSLRSNFRLSGIGKFQFLGCDEHVLNEDISMYTLSYHGIHFTEDIGTVNMPS